MATPPYLPPLHIVLQALKNEFELTDEQLAALPPLDEVELVPQSDSRLIQHAQPGSFTYHPYKLFIGKTEEDFFHAYLQRTSGRKQYQIELFSVDTEIDPPLDATYFGTVKDLAYPFNTFLGGRRFVAVVKWYFLLAFRGGEFDEDPGFSVTASWSKELQGACNELIAAPQIEEDRQLKDSEKSIAEMRRAGGREQRESQVAVKQTIEYQKTDAILSKPRTQADDRPRRTSTHKELAPTTDHKNDKDVRGHQLRQTADRRAVHPPRVTAPHDQALLPPPLQSWPGVGHSKDHIRQRDRAPRGLEQSPQPDPHPRNARPPRYRSDPREASPPRYEQTRRDEHRVTNTIFTPTNTEPRERRKVRGGAAVGKSDIIKEDIVPTKQRPAQRRKRENTAKDNDRDTIDGTADNKDEGDDVTRMSWTQEVERLTSVEEDEVNEDDMAGKEFEPTDDKKALRKAEWMRLYRQKVEIAGQMRNLENEMTVNDRLDVFDKVKYA